MQSSINKDSENWDPAKHEHQHKHSDNNIITHTIYTKYTSYSSRRNHRPVDTTFSKFYYQKRRKMFDKTYYDQKYCRIIEIEMIIFYKLFE